MINFLSQYEGDITITEEQNYKAYTLKNKNRLTDHWGKDHLVMCSVSIHENYDGSYSVWADEQTCSILGGCGSRYDTQKEAFKRADVLLERYGFKRKTQMTLF